jgi:hypothetical protein
MSGTPSGAARGDLCYPSRSATATGHTFGKADLGRDTRCSGVSERHDCDRYIASALVAHLGTRAASRVMTSTAFCRDECGVVTCDPVPDR